MISVASMAAAAATCACLCATGHVESDAAHRVLYLVAAATIQLRLLCNVIDGLVAVEGGMRSPTGELYNEAPDRVSDALTLIGAGYAAGSCPELGYLAAIVAIMTAYIRALGKGAGAGSDFGGPMAKPHRMATMTVTCVLLAIIPAAWRGWPGQGMSFPAPLQGFEGRAGLMTVCLLVITLGSVLTCVLRLRRIAASLWAKGLAP